MLAVADALVVAQLRLAPVTGLVSLAVAVAFGAAAWRVRALDLTGAIAAVLLAWVLLAPADIAWAAPGLTFFLLSSALSRIGRRRKAQADRLVDKTGPRDVGQVVANGGLAGALVVVFLLLPDAYAHLTPALYWAMTGAFAAAAADTWATEVGTLVGGPTWRLPSMKRVPAGTSGGVSVAGTLAAVAGAVSVFAAAWIATGGAREFVASAGIGVAAALTIGGAMAACVTDSLLGGTVQARYRLESGELTERAVDMGHALPLAAGFASMNNDRVNLACTLVGAMIPFLGFTRTGLA